MNSRRFHPTLKSLLLGTAGLALIAGSSALSHAQGVVSDPFASSVSESQVAPSPAPQSSARQPAARSAQPVIKINPADMDKLKALRASSLKIEPLGDTSRPSPLYKEGNKEEVVAASAREPAQSSKPQSSGQRTIIQSSPLVEMRNGRLVKVGSVAPAPSAPVSAPQAMPATQPAPKAELPPVELEAKAAPIEPKSMMKAQRITAPPAAPEYVAAPEPAPALETVQRGNRVFIASNPEILKSIPGFAQNVIAPQKAQMPTEVKPSMAAPEPVIERETIAMAAPVALAPADHAMPQSPSYREAGYEVDSSLASDLKPIKEPEPLPPLDVTIEKEAIIETQSAPKPEPLQSQQIAAPVRPELTPDQIEAIVERVLDQKLEQSVERSVEERVTPAIENAVERAVVRAQAGKEAIDADLKLELEKKARDLAWKMAWEKERAKQMPAGDEIVESAAQPPENPPAQQNVQASVTLPEETDISADAAPEPLTPDPQSPKTERVKMEVVTVDLGDEAEKDLQAEQQDDRPVLMGDVARQAAEDILAEEKARRFDVSREVKLDDDDLPVVESMDPDALAADTFTSVETLGKRVKTPSDEGQNFYSKSVPVREKGLAVPVADVAEDEIDNEPWPSDPYSVVMPPMVERVFWTNEPSFKRWRAVRSRDMIDVLRDWAKASDVKVIWHTDSRFAVLESVSLDGTFEEAVSTLLGQYSQSRIRPRGRLHIDPKTGERALVITALGERER